MKEVKFKKIVQFAFLILFYLFVDCKENATVSRNAINFNYEARFETIDETIFKLNKTTIKLFPDEPNHIQIFTDKQGGKIDIREENSCNMDAVGTSVYQYTSSNEPNLRIMIIEDYQDILTGSIYAVLLDKSTLIKTFRFCGPQYNFEKYDIKDVLKIEKKGNEISFTFDPKKLVTHSENIQNAFKFNIAKNQPKKSDSVVNKTLKKEIKSNEDQNKFLLNKIVIDSLIFDFNDDNIADKILIRADSNEDKFYGDKYFDNIDSYFRNIEIFLGTKNKSYIQIASNKDIIPCLRCNEPLQSYSNLKHSAKNFFSVDIIKKSNNSIYQLFFEWKKDNFYLIKIKVQSFSDENSETVNLENGINFNKIKMNSILEYINQ